MLQSFPMLITVVRSIHLSSHFAQYIIIGAPRSIISFHRNILVYRFYTFKTLAFFTGWRDICVCRFAYHVISSRTLFTTGK